MTFSVLAFCRCERLFRPPARQCPLFTSPTYAGSDLYGVLEPARTVSGNFYDVIRLDGDRVGLVVADVSGKRLPAAMLMMSARTLAHGLAIAANDPREALAEVNEVLCEDNPLMTFVTTWFGIFDPADGTSATVNPTMTATSLSTLGN